MKTFCALLMLLVLSLSNACSFDPIKQALGELDNLQKIINNRTGDLNAEMEKWRKELPEEVRGLIEDDVAKVSRDIVGATGAETKCTVDFLRARFVQSVENIKKKLLHQPYLNPKPCFCTLNLPQINPNADTKSIQTLNVYGYDFNSPDSSDVLMKVALVGDSGVLFIDDKYIGRTTNYQLAVNLIDILPEIASNKYSKIKIFWNGEAKGLSEALISKWQPERKLVPFAPRSFSWYPPHTGGDADFDTDTKNWANGSVELQLRKQENMIQGRLFYTVMEFGGDNTTVGMRPNDEAPAWSEWKTIYTNDDTDFELVDFSPSAPPRYHFAVTDHGPKRYGQGGGAVEQFVVYVDENGDDVANCHADVIFNQMNAVLLRKRPVRK